MRALNIESKDLGEEMAMPNNLTQIVPGGDLVLQIDHDIEEATHRSSFRVESTVLKANSRYFDRLLSNDRFGEGQHVKDTHDRLRQSYGEVTSAPAAELPTLHIEHVGRISHVKSITTLLTDFFSILHNIEKNVIPPVANLANLAIVADRFDALVAVSQFVRRRKIIQAIEARTTAKQEEGLSEEKARQRLLVGILLDHTAWVERYSARMIIRGHATEAADVPDILWWDLPGRMEEELVFRRRCVLQTIQDLQQSYLQLFSSRTQQCRLGYDSSKQCDSFQLGEMVRFFLRIGTLRLQGVLKPSEASEASFEGDIYLLIEQLRQVPEYQVDQNHSHCGIRTRLIPALTLIAGALSHIGICGDCWRDNRNEHRWSLSKPPVLWGRLRHAPLASVGSHERRHELVKALFMAQERQWD